MDAHAHPYEASTRTRARESYILQDVVCLILLAHGPISTDTSSTNLTLRVGRVAGRQCCCCPEGVKAQDRTDGRALLLGSDSLETERLVLSSLKPVTRNATGSPGTACHDWIGSSRSRHQGHHYGHFTSPLLLPYNAETEQNWHTWRRPARRAEYGHIQSDGACLPFRTVP